MLNVIAYKLMWELRLQGGGWEGAELCGLAKVPVAKGIPCLLGLIRRELIRRRAGGYELTEEGDAELDRSIDDPYLTQDAKAWIARVRAGIDGRGRETKVQRAAIPDHFEPLTSYTPDLEGAIDLLRKELAEYD